MIRWLLVGLAGLVGCNTLQKGACENVVEEICDQCDVSDSYKDTVCACVIDGEVENSDDYFEDDDEAERWCWGLQASLKPTYLTNEDVSYCRLELDYIREYEDDACDDWGYNDDGSTTSYYSSTYYQ